jgi:hypothetical protein
MPSKSSTSGSNDVLAAGAASALELATVPEVCRPEEAASFSAASRRSGSLVPRRLSGSINSSAEATGSPFRDPAWAESPEDEDAAPTGTLPSMGASTGRSVSGSKTGRDAASIISSLVDASPNCKSEWTEQARLHGRAPPQSVAFDALGVSTRI